jgi:cytidylate kinase
MEVQKPTGAQMRAVTISREYGSGGGEIASRLAARLGWRLVDHEIVVQVARELDISEEEAASRDESAQSTVSLILNSMRAVNPAMFSLAPAPIESDEQTYREALTRVVEAAAATGHVVIVGRASQVLLANYRDVLHMRIVAPFEKRVQYVMKREALKKEEARTRIQLKDRDRLRYLQIEYHHRPDEAQLYDLVINTGVLDLDSAVNLIVQALEYKASRLLVPDEQLGPAAGLPPYPGHPGDIRPPEAG